MGFSGLGIAVSGMTAARLNLAVTGHNMANAELRGYSRQRIIQTTALVRNLGIGTAGTPMIHNMGTDWQAVSQMRDQFLDFTYREHVSKLQFYSVLSTVGAELESMLGELHSGFSLQNTITDIWRSIQELTSSPGSLETRAFFISRAGAFLEKAQSVYNNMVEYQFNLDGQIRQAVNEINDIVLEIRDLNEIISAARASGDNPNDFLDRRNLLLDSLSEIIPIETKIDGRGNVLITSGRHELLNGSFVNTLGLRFTSDSVTFVEPIFTRDDQILSSGSDPRYFTPFMDWNRGINDNLGNDMGRLAALMLARGSEPVTNLSPTSIPAMFPELAVMYGWNHTDDFTDFTQGPPPGDGWAKFEALALAVGVSPNDIAIWTVPADAVTDITASIANRNPPPTNMAQVTASLTALTTWNGTGTSAAFEALLEPIRDALNPTWREDYRASAYNHNMLMWSIEHSTISQAQLGLDRIVLGIVNLINDTLTGRLKTVDAQGNIVEFDQRIPVDANGDEGEDLFVVRPQGLAAGGIHAQFTLRNIIINPSMQGPGGHNKLALSLDRPPSPDDDRLLIGLQAEWQRANSPYGVNVAGRTSNIQDAYIRFVSHISIQTQEAATVAGTQTTMVIQADARRNAIKGVSMDEEMSNMLRFQFAFQSSSRMLNVMDSMLDRIINGMGAGRG